jgi:hypothetical protein
MKKRFYIKTTFFSLAAMALLSSCLKDNAHFINFAGGGVLVELPLAEVGDQAGIGGPFQTTTFGLAPTADDTLIVAVNVASPTPLTSALNVTLTTTDLTALNSYNTANGTSYTPLPSADYKVLGSLTATVPANARLAYIKIVVNATAVGAANSGSFVLPITIASASGQPIAQPEKALLYNILISNQYAGNYGVNGYVFRDTGGGINDPSLGGNFSGFTQALGTVSAYAVTWAPLWATGQDAAGVGGTTLTVDPATNNVTIASSANVTLVNAPGYTSHYDPAKQTFYISYKWGTAPSDRAETDTLSAQ